MGIVSVIAAGSCVYTIVLGAALNAGLLAIIWMIALVLTINGIIEEAKDKIIDTLKISPQ